MLQNITTKWLLLSLFFIYAQSRFEFTNLKCITTDPEYSNFDYCSVKAVNRTYSYIGIKAKLLQVPISNITVVATVLKNSNGYKPFLFDISVDGCKFMERGKNPVAKFLYSLIKDVSNINHTCPYDHDIVVDKLSNKHLERLLASFPTLSGEYAIFTKWSTDNVLRATVNGYGKFINI